MLEGETVILIKQGTKDNRRHGIQGTAHGSNIEHNEGDNEHYHGDDELGTALKHRDKQGDILFIHAEQVIFQGFHIHHDEHADVIKESRNSSCHTDGAIADAGHFRQDEGSSTHDGRHDLAAGGSNGFHCAGKDGTIAAAFHHGDGEGAGGNDIGDRAAGDGTEDSGSDNGDLGGAAAFTAGQRGRKIAEDEISAADIEEGTKQQEQEYGIGGNADGHTEDTLLAENGLDDAGKAVALVADEAGEMFAEEGIQNGDERDGGQRGAGQTAAALQHDDGADGAHDDIGGTGNEIHAQQEGIDIPQNVDGDRCDAQGQDNIKNLGWTVKISLLAFVIVHQVAHKHAEHEVDHKELGADKERIDHIDDLHSAHGKAQRRNDKAIDAVTLFLLLV